MKDSGIKSCCECRSNCGLDLYQTEPGYQGWRSVGPCALCLWIGMVVLVESQMSREEKCTKVFTIGSASVADDLGNLPVRLRAYSMEGDIAILGTRDVFRCIYRGEVMGVLREVLGVLRGIIVIYKLRVFS